MTDTCCLTDAKLTTGGGSLQRAAAKNPFIPLGSQSTICHCVRRPDGDLFTPVTGAQAITSSHFSTGAVEPMTATGGKRTNDKDEIASGYQSMVRTPPTSLPPMVQHDDPTDESDDAFVDVDGDTAPPRNALQRFVKHFRVLEFGSAVILYVLELVFAKIEVHERPIPGIKVRLNATAIAWSLDPSIDEKKLSEEGMFSATGSCYLQEI
ncbi:unnamed protein product [Phytophthora lilii]|uniref:Unnamed protein product n=1 Tax=Phytophthora lilii TaxID=2077276 RepID=A0A9W6TDE8_9STRA|nr:unnamed protein product [Phytophthora lilii]